MYEGKATEKFYVPKYRQRERFLSRRELDPLCIRTYGTYACVRALWPGPAIKTLAVATATFRFYATYNPGTLLRTFESLLLGKFYMLRDRCSTSDRMLEHLSAKFSVLGSAVLPERGITATIRRHSQS